MPRNYIRKTDWGLATYEELEKAFVEVKHGKSIRTVAKERKISRSTLQRYMKKAEGQREKTVGYRGTSEANRIFNEELEEKLAENIKMLAERIHGVTAKKCREMAFEMAQKNNIPVPNNWGEQRLAGRDWFRSFIARHNLYCHISEATSLASHGQVICFNLINQDEMKKDIIEENHVAAPLHNVLEDENAEVKKKWSDLKMATKRCVSALKRSQSQTGGGPPDPSLQLTPHEEWVAALIGTASLEGITGGGDTDDIHDDATAGPSTLEASPPQPIQEPEPILAPHPEPEQVQAREAEARPPASCAPRPRVLTDEVLERQTEICRLLVEINNSLVSINMTLKQINENLKK